MTSPIAKNLKRLRKDAGLTQEALALACGWSGQGVIGNYESLKADANQPSPEKLVAIAGVLGVSVAELFGEAPPRGERTSHLGRIDFGKMAIATKALLDAVELTGSPPEWAFDPPLLELAYQSVDALGDKLDHLGLVKELAKTIRGRANDDEVSGRRATAAIRGIDASGGDKG